MEFLNTITTGEIVNAAILVVTAAILGVTAWIVWEYTKAAQKSNELQEKPILNLYLVQERMVTGGYHFELKNIGRGPAFNVEIADIESKEWTHRLFIDDPNPILEQGGEGKKVEVRNKMKKQNSVVEGFRHFHQYLFSNTIEKVLFEDSNTHDIEARHLGLIGVSYRGVSGKKYFSVFRFYSKISVGNDYVIEFIQEGEGELNLERVREICKKRPILRHIYS